MFTFFTKREIIGFEFTSLSCSGDKEIYKKSLMHLQSLLFCQSKPIAFFAILVDVAFVLASWSSLMQGLLTWPFR